MLQSKNTRTNQIEFLTAFTKAWEFTNEVTDNDEPINNLTNLYDAFISIAGLPEMSAEDLLAELEQIPDLMTWKQLKQSNECFDASGITEELGGCENWLWNKITNSPLSNVWFPVIDLSKSTKRFIYRDKTGRGFYDINLRGDAVMDWQEDDKSDNGELLTAWAIDAEQGDVWENSTTRFECTD